MLDVERRYPYYPYELSLRRAFIHNIIYDYIVINANFALVKFEEDGLFVKLSDNENLNENELWIFIMEHV